MDDGDCTRQQEAGIRCEIRTLPPIWDTVVCTTYVVFTSRLNAFFFKVYFVFIGKLDKKREETERKIQ